jgi:site-specific recombinase XerD
MAVKFYLENRMSKRTGEYAIRASFSIKGTKMISTIGILVSAEVWGNEKVDPEIGQDKKKSGKKGKVVYKNAKGMTDKQINAVLLQIKSHFAQYELEMKHKPTTAELREQLAIALRKDGEEPVAEEKKPKVKSAPGFYENFDEFVREQGMVNQWAYATRQTWKTFKNHLLAFNKKAKYEYFNESGINRYVSFLRSTEGMEEKTVQKHFSQLKWFLNWAIRKGYCTNEAINKYRPKFKVLQKPVIFLTKEELLKLYNYQIPANGTKVKLFDMQGMEYEKKVEEAGALAKTRDLFCFCAFTSLRYSDMAKVKRIDIEGKQLYVTTQKTNDRLPIDLNSFALEILDKYKDEKFPEGLALPVISNQKMNHYLKDLGELCGFNNPITRVCYRGGERVEETFPKYALIGTHAGRRTFICFALSSGIPPQVVMKWTGHSDYKAMKPYIDIAEKTKANAMNLFEMELKK